MTLKTRIQHYDDKTVTISKQKRLWPRRSSHST